MQDESYDLHKKEKFLPLLQSGQTLQLLMNLLKNQELIKL